MRGMDGKTVCETLINIILFVILTERIIVSSSSLFFCKTKHYKEQRLMCFCVMMWHVNGKLGKEQHSIATLCTSSINMHPITFLRLQYCSITASVGLVDG